MSSLKTLIIIGASTGGPVALRKILSGMPMLNAAVVIVQHMPVYTNNSFVKTLNADTDMIVKLAGNGERLKSGGVYVAPSNIHLTLLGNRVIRLQKGGKVNFVCPAVDVAMRSLTEDPGLMMVGVLLTGMGADGAAGMKHIKEIGGTTIAQDKNSSVIFGMPQAAQDTGAVDMVMDPERIRNKLIELTGVSTFSVNR